MKKIATKSVALLLSVLMLITLIPSSVVGADEWGGSAETAQEETTVLAEASEDEALEVTLENPDEDADEEAQGEEVQAEDAQDEEVQDEEAQGEEVQNEEVQDEEAQGEEVQDAQAQDEEVQDAQAQGEDIQDEEVQDEDVQGEDIQETDAEVEDDTASASEEYEAPALDADDEIWSLNTSTRTWTSIAELGSSIWDSRNDDAVLTNAVVGDKFVLKHATDNDKWSITNVNSNILSLTAKDGSDGSGTAVGPGSVSFTRYYRKHLTSSKYYKQMNYVITILPYVSASVDSATMIVGDTQNINVTTNTGSFAVSNTYSSSDSSIVSVDSDGKLTAKDAGTATITVKATSNGQSNTATVTVTVLPKVSVAQVPEIREGNSANLSVTVNPSDAKLTYASSDTSIATVDANGKVTAVSYGKASIIVTATKNGMNASTTTEVTVLGNIKSVVLNPSPVEMRIGQTQDIVATLEYFDEEGKKDYQAEWAIYSGDDIISLSDPGTTGLTNSIVAGTKKGSAVVMITVGGITESTTVKVSGITFAITPTEGNLCKEENLQLYITSNLAKVDNYTVEWSSSDEAVATVSEEGVVTGVDIGTADISAVVTYAGAQFDAGSCTISINENVKSVKYKQTNKELIPSVEETTLSVPEGTDYTFILEIQTKDGTIPQATWTSSNTRVGTVTSKSKISASVVAAKNGTTDIIATAEGHKAIAHLNVVSNIESVNFPTSISLYKNETFDVFDGTIEYVDGSGRKIGGDDGYTYSIVSVDGSECIRISEDGTIEGICDGHTNVLVSIEGEEDHFIEVTVKETFESWELDPAFVDMTVAGSEEHGPNTYNLKEHILITYTDDDGVTHSDVPFIGSPYENITDLEWVSVNEDIASVDDNGIVTAKKSGYATISIVAGIKILNAKIIVLDEDGNLPVTPDQRFSVIIHYVFGSGQHAGETVAADYTAHYPAGSLVNISVESPTYIIGYKPETTLYEETVWGITGKMERTIYYYPSSNQFTVNYYKETATANVYEQSNTRTVPAKTEDSISLYAALYDESAPEGYYKVPYNRTAKVAADGSTEVNIYYKRQSFMIDFKLNGGTGTYPIYGAWGKSVSISNPTRYGYTFTGWYEDAACTKKVDLANNFTIPMENKVYYAGWENSKTTYRVIYWVEKYDSTEEKDAEVVDPENYSFYSTEAKTGTTKDMTNETGLSEGISGFQPHNITQQRIEGDGSTIINVYYYRNWHTLTFKYNNAVVYTITAKYGADISDHFDSEIEGSLVSKYKAYQWKSQNSTTYKNYYVATLESMPDENVTFVGEAYSNNGSDLHYWLQKVGTTVSSTASWPSTSEKANFELHKTVPYTSSLQKTYNEEYHEISGFTRYPEGSGGWTSSETEYYYKRNSYTLQFISGEYTTRTESRQFEQSLSDLSSYVPGEEYRPSSVDPDYKFDGWYADAECTVPFDFDSKMPASNMAVYAKWSPIKVTLTVISRNIDNASNSLKFQVDKGSKFEDAEESWSEVPTGESRKFIGWFYDNGEPFSFELSINEDTTVRAQFSSDKEVTVKINYVSEDGKTILAESKEETSFESVTVTYRAEAILGTDENWFPVTNSHSFTLDPDQKDAEVIYDSYSETYTYNFKYKKVDKVNYTINYVEVGTGEVLLDPVVASTSDKVITAFAKSISGYRATSRLQYLTLSANEEENVITFYYNKIDTTKGFVEIYHWIENPTRPGTYLQTEYAYETDFDAEIGSAYSYTPLTISGYTCKPDKTTYYTGDVKGENKVTAEGLLINVYYDCSQYAYEFKFVDYYTGEAVAESVTGEDSYNSVVKQKAKDVSGYTLVSADTQSITVTSKTDKNVKIFSYVENTATITYSALLPGGTVSQARETVKVISGTAKGSVAEADENYEFAGWYADEACKNLITTETTLIPEKVSGMYEDAEYFAKFKTTTSNVSVRHYLNGTTMEVAESTAFQGNIGEVATASAVTIEGYTPVKPSESITVGDKDNVIILYYYKNLTLTADSRTVTYSGLDQSVSGYEYDGAIDKYEPSFEGLGISAGATGKDAGEYTSEFTGVTVGKTVDVSGKYLITEATSGTLTINKAKLTVETENGSKVYDGTALTAKGTISGLKNGEEVTFSVTGSQSAVGTSQNTYAILWDKSAKDSNYEIEEDLGMLEVTEYAGLITVTTTGGTFTYDGKAHGATVKVTGLPKNGYTVKSATCNTTATDVTNGTVTVTCTELIIENADGEDVTDNLNITKVDGTIKINRKVVTVTANNKTKTYGSADPAFDAKVVGTLGSDTVKYSFKRTPGESVGTYDIKVSGDNNQGNYSVTYAPGKLEIVAAGTLSITGTDWSGTYTGTSHGEAAVVNITDGTTITYSVNGGEFKDEVPNITNVGTMTVTAKATNPNYTDATCNYTIEVKQATVKVKANDETMTYGADVPAFSATVTGLVNNESTSLISYKLSCDATKASNVGDYDINVTEAKDSSGNYNVITENGTLTINKSNAMTIDVDGCEYSGIYDGAEHGNAATTPGVTGTTITYSVNGGEYTSAVPKIKNVGTVKVTVKAENNNYETKTASYELVVTQKDVTVKADNKEAVYGEAEKTLTATVTGTLGEDTVKYTLSRAAGTNVGTYTITPSAVASQGNYNVKTETGSYVITKSDKLSISVEGAGFSGTYDGKSHGSSVTPSVTKDTTVEYSTDGGETWTAKYPTRTDAGTTDVKVRATNSNYKDAKEVTYSIVVNKRAVTLTSGSGTKVYDGKELTNKTVTVSGDGFADNEGATYTVTGSRTTVGSSKNTFLYALKDGTKAANYTITQVEGDLKVTKSTALKITASGYNGTYDGADHSVVAEASDKSGTTIKYQIEGSSEWLDEAPSIKNVGELKVTIKAENANYEDVTKEVTLKVTKAKVTITPFNSSKTYGEKDPELTANVDGKVSGETINYTLSREEGEEPGTYSITVDVDEEKYGNYDITCKTAEFTIDKAETLKVTVTSFEGTYDGAEHSGSAVANVLEGTTISYKVGDGEWTTTAPVRKDAGTTTVQVQAVNSRYETATGTYTIKVNPKEVSVKANDASKTYGESDPTFTATVKGLVGTDTISYGFERTAGDDAGTYTITAKGDKNQGNYTVTYGTGTFTINKSKALKVTCDNYSGTYNGEAQGVTAKVTANGQTVYSAKIKYSENETDWYENAPRVIDAGTRTIHVVATDDNYEDATCSYTIEIKKRSVSLTSATAEKVYDGTALTAGTITVGDMGFVDGEGAHYSITGKQTSAGSSTNTFTYELNEGTSADNYSITKTEGTLTVTRSSALTVSGTDYTGVYDGEEHGDAAVAMISGKVANGIEIKYSTNGGSSYSSTVPKIKDAGTVTVKVNAVDTDENYIIAECSYTLTVTAREITLTSATDDKEYDGTALTNSEVTDTLTGKSGNGFVDGEGATYDVTGSQTVAGNSKNTFTYKLNEGTIAKNYIITKSEGTLTIAPVAQEIVITANSNTKKYDGTALTDSGFTYTEDVLAEGDRIVAVVKGTITDAGSVSNVVESYKVKRGEKDVTGCYTFGTSVNGTLEITPRDVTLTSATDSKDYDGTTLTNEEVTISGDGFVEGEGAIWEVTGNKTNAGSRANEFTYTLSEGTKPGNYNIKVVKGTLTINKKAAKITVDSKEKTYGDADPTLTAVVTGLIEGDHLDYSLSRATGEDVKEGGYAISATLTTTPANYEVELVPGTLTINKRSITLTSASESKVYDGTALTNSNVTDTVTKTTDKGFAFDDGASYSVTGTQTVAGSSDNTFTYTLNEGTKASNYEISTATGTLTVTKKTNAITIKANSKSKKYDGTALTDNGYTYTQGVLAAGDTLTAVVEGTITDAGETDNTVTSYKVMRDKTDVTDCYTFAESVNGKLTVTKRNVTLTSATATKTYDGEPLTNSNVTVTSDGFVSGQGATYNVTGTQTLTGSSSNTFDYTLKEGTKASNYEITKTEGTLTVTENTNTIVITANSASKTYDGTALTDSGYTYTQGILAEGDVLTAVVEGEITDAGSTANVVTSYVVKNGKTDVTENYTFAPSVNGTLTVNPRTVTLTSETIEKVYDGKPLTGSNITVGEDGFIDGEGADYTVTGTITDKGSVANAFTYELKEGTKEVNYSISKTEGTLTVTEKTDAITITAKSASKTYDGTALTEAGYTYTQGVLVEGDVLTAVVEGEITDAGSTANVVTSYVVKRGETDVTDNYTFATSVEGTLKVNKRKITLTSANVTREYDGTALTDATVTDTITGGKDKGFVDGEGADYTVSGTQTVAGSSDNTFTYDLNEGTEASNYEITTVAGKLTVTKKATPIVITAGSDEKVYDGTVLTCSSYDYTKDVLVDGDELVVTVSGSRINYGEAANMVTSYKVMRGEEEVTKCYTFDESVNGTLKVTKRDVTLTSATDSKTYDGSALTNGGVEVTGAGFVSGEGAVYTVTGTQTLAGSSDNSFTYKLTASTKAENYNISTKEGKLTVNPITDKKITISAKSASKTYDGTALTEAGYTYTDGILVEGDVLTAVVEGTITDAGKMANVVTSYKVMKGEIDVTSCYTFEKSTKGSLVVTKRNITLTSGTASKTFDGTALTKDGIEVTGDGFVSGEGADYTVTGTQTAAGSSKNTFTYKLKEGTKAGNYAIKTVEGTLTVNKSLGWTLNVNPAGYRGTYDGKNHGGKAVPSIEEGTTVSYSIDGGITWSETYPQVKNVADSVTVMVKAENPNYETINSEYDLTVNPKEVKVTANDITKTFGQDDPELTVTITGTIGGDKVDYVIEREIGYESGDYEIKVSGEEKQDNYKVKFEKGIFTIEPATGLALETDCAKFTGMYDGEPHGDEAVASIKEGTTVSYSTDGEEWSDEYPTLTDVGTLKVYVKAENPGYKTITKTYEINVTPRYVVLTSDSASKTYDGEELVAKNVTAGGYGFVDGQGFTFDVTGSQSEVGSSDNEFTYELEDGTEASNYDIHVEKGTLKVTKSNGLNVTGEGYNGPYDGKEHYVSTIVEPEKGTTIWYSTDGGETWTKDEIPYIKDAGKLEVLIKAENPNYEDTFAKVVINISRAAVTVKADDQCKIYGSEDPELTATVTGLIGDDEIEYSLERVEGEAVGEYEITASGDKEQDNYEVTFISGHMQIASSDGLQVFGFDYSAPYNGKNQEVPAVANIKEGTELLYSVDGGEWSSDVPSRKSAGTSEVTVKATNPGYDEVTGTYTITITRAPLTITTESAEREYNGKALTAGGSVNGLVSGESVGFKTTGTVTDPGDAVDNGYEITWGDVDSENYEVITELGKLKVTVNTDAIQIIANDATKEYDGLPLTEKNFTWYGSLPEGETIEATTSGTITYVGSTANKIDSYRIMRNGVDIKEFYTFVESKDGTLTITAPSDASKVVTKSAEQREYKIGETITYTIRVTNIYNTNKNITIVEMPEMEIEKSQFNDVQPGATISTTATHVVTREDTLKGSVSNTVTVKFDGEAIDYPGDETVPTTIEMLITAASASKYYDGKALTDSGYTYTEENLKAGDKLTAVVKGTITNAGVVANVITSYKITRAGEDVTAEYDVVTKDGTLTVNKSLEWTLDVNPADYQGTYDGKLHGSAAVPSIKKGTVVTYSIDGGITWSKNYPQVKNVADSVTVMVKAENPNYETINSEYDLIVTPKEVKVTADHITKTFGQDDPELTVTTEGTVGGDKIDYEIEREKGYVPGDYEIKVTGEENQGNYKVTFEKGTFTIEPATGLALETDCAKFDGMYDGEPHGSEAVPNVTDGTKIYYSTDDGQTWSEEYPTLTDASTITVTVKAENPGYETVEKTYEINVTPRYVVLTSDSASKPYDGSALVAKNVTVGGYGFVKNQGAKYTVTGSQSEVGSSENAFTYELKSGTKASNYDIHTENGTLEVTKSSQFSVTGEGYSGSYDGKEHYVSAEASVVPGTTIWYSTDGGETWTKDEIPYIKDAGKLEVLIKAENPNYEDAFAKVVINIARAAVTVKADDKCKTYGSADPELTATVMGTVGEDTIKYTLKREDGEGVGTYKITVSGKKEQGNYEVTFVSGRMQIASSDGLQVFGFNYSAPYSGQEQKVPAVANIKEDTELKYSTDGGTTWTSEIPSRKDAGTTKVMVKATNPGYDDVIGEYTITITKATLKVTTEDGEQEYNGKALTAGGSVSGLVSGEYVTFKTTGSQTDVGTSENSYEIAMKKEPIEKNYTIVENIGSLTVKKNTTAIRIIANDATKEYDGTPLTEESFTWYGNLPAGETIKATTSGSITYVGTADNKIASYKILRGGKDIKSFYTFVTPEKGTLTITEPTDASKVVAKSAEQKEYKLGETIIYTIKATNIYATKKNITIVEMPGMVLDKSEFKNVASGATVSTTATHVVTEEDILKGSVSNTVKVKFDGEDKQYPGKEEVPTVKKSSKLTITKTDDVAEGEKVALGQEITYTIKVTNSGNVSANDVEVTDELTGNTGDNTLKLGTILPGKYKTVQVKYTVTEDDIIRGYIANTATVKGVDPEGDPEEGQGEEKTTTEEKNNKLTVTKTANVADGEKVALGQEISYTITVKNDGNVSASDVEVIDELTGNTGDNTLKLGTILPGKYKSVEVKYTVTEADIARGYVSNTATAKGTDPEGDPSEGGDEEKTPTEKKNNTLQVVKTSDVTGPVNVGDEITYTITVTNKGNVTVNNIKVEDALTGNTGDEAITIESLAPGKSSSVEVKYTVTEADVAKGTIANTATVKGEDITGDEPEGEGKTEVPTIVNTPGINVNVVPSVPDGTVFQPGETVTYTVTVTNNGNVDLNNVVVVDTLTGTNRNIGIMTVGQVVTFTITYTLTEDDVFRMNGTLTNKITATGNYEGTTVTGTTVTDEKTATVNILNAVAELKVDKQYTNKGEVLKVGDVMKFTITVTNSGNVKLYNVKVTDNLKNASGSIVIDDAAGGTVNGNVITFAEIAAGATKTITCSYTTTEKDAGADISNMASVTGESAGGKQVSSDSPETTPTNVKQVYRVVIHYVDKDGNKVADDFIGEFYEGEEFVIEAPYVDGYTAAYLKVYSPEGGMPASSIELSVIMHDEEGFVPSEEGQIEIDETGKAYEIVSLDKGEVPLDEQAFDGDHYCILHILIFLAALILFIIFLFDNRKHQKNIEKLENQIKDLGGRE